MIPPGAEAIQRPANYCPLLNIQGRIQKGDYARLRQIVAANEPWLKSVAIASPGGDVAEAVAMGRLIRQRLIGTIAPLAFGEKEIDIASLFIFAGMCRSKSVENCNCASACLFVWIGGAHRSGDVLIVHRPFDPSARFGQMSASEARAEYDRVLRLMQSYLIEMDAPSWLFDVVRQVPSDQSRRLSREQTDGLIGYVPSIHELTSPLERNRVQS
jgi:hypothetical protein